MAETTFITELFENFAIPVVMLIVFIIAIAYLYNDSRKREDKHDADTKEMTEKYYESYIKVTDSNAKVSDALNNNTKVIEKLFDKLG